MNPETHKPSPSRETARNQLMETLASLIDLMRKILSCVHAERVAITRKDWPTLERILSERQHHLHASGPLIAQFFVRMQKLIPSPLPTGSLMEELSRLQEALPPDDVDLLLYAGQLHVITQEINQQTRSLVAALENQSIHSPNINSLLVKVAPQTTRQTLMVADQETLPE